MNIDTNILNELLTNQIEHHIKRIIHRDGGGLSQECKVYLKFKNQFI